MFMRRRLYNRKYFILTLLGLCHVIALPAQVGFVRGWVTNGIEDLPNATVSLDSQTCITKINGKFEFTVPAGKYTLMITHIGYSKIAETIEVKAGEIRTLHYTLIAFDHQEEELVIHSISGTKRNKFDAPVNVVSISEKALLQTGQPSLVQRLSATVPSISISSRQPTWDNVTFRGLNPDQSLLLVNNSRYVARSSLTPIGPLTGQLGTPGSVVNDFYAIPQAAIEKIEILFDGAFAQYGSDAIGAVVNMKLKESTGKTFITLHTGQYYKNQGENVDLGFYRGFRILRKGFLGLSGNYNYRAPTFSGELYKGRVYVEDSVLDRQKIAERGFDISSIPPGYESMELQSASLSANGGTPIKENLELFWTGIFSYRYPSYPTSFRLPKNVLQVNLELFPDGFLARSYSPVWDLSFTAGAKGKTSDGWNWDFISSYGRNKVSMESHNNNNASQEFLLGKYAQTDFECGGTSFSQFLNNAHFSKRIIRPNKKIKVIHPAVGGEWRLEKYQITPGEEAAWQNYDPTFKKQGGVQAPFFGESDKIKVNRNVLALYAEIETEINDHFLVDMAARLESYSDYGSCLAGKFAARYKFSEKFSMRGSISNNFRAPPLQQAYYSSTQNGWSIDSNGSRIPSVSGVYRNNHDVVSRDFGVRKLEPEKAVNVSGGIASHVSSRMNFTIDAYWIQIKDRIVFSKRFEKSNNPKVAEILRDYPGVDGVQFACNAVSTRTIGADVAINSNWTVLKGQLGFTLAANFNRTDVYGIVQAAANLPADPLNTNLLFNRGEIGRMEKLQPSSKIIFTTDYIKGKWAFTMINRRFGSTEFIHPDSPTKDEFFSAKIVTDFNLRFSPREWCTITVGCNNIFNVKPDPVKNYANTNEGKATYGSQYLPVSPNGGYYFVGLAFNFSTPDKEKSKIK